MEINVDRDNKILIHWGTDFKTLKCTWKIVNATWLIRISTICHLCLLWENPKPTTETEQPFHPKLRYIVRPAIYSKRLSAQYNIKGLFSRGRRRLEDWS